MSELVNTPSTLARLALSSYARAVSAAARPLVLTGSDVEGHPGELVQRAAHMAETACDLLQAAVISERLKDTTWEEIGAALGGRTRQAAYDRYRAAEGVFRR